MKNKGISRRRWSGPVLLTVFALIISACGSSSSGGSASSKSGGASGSPVIFEVITSIPSAQATPQPEVQASQQALADTLNASGGIDGHPVKVVTCKDNADPNLSRQCATQAINNPNVVAVWTDSFVGGTANDPLLAKAGLPAIGIFPLTAQDAQCSVCFPLNGGGFVDALAIPILLHTAHGATNINFQHYTSGTPLVAASQKNFESTVSGGKVESTLIAPTTTDYSNLVAEAKSSGAQAVGLLAIGSVFTGWVQTAHQLGYNVPVASVAAAITPAAAQSLGNLIAGIIAPCGTMPTSATGVPGIDTYKSQMAKYAPKAAITANGLYAWAAMKMFADTAATIKGPVTRTSVLQAMNQLRNYTIGGIIPPYSTDKPWDGLGGQAPRLFNHSVVSCEATSDGGLKAASQTFITPVA